MTTTAPRFNSFNALKPVRIPSRSGVTAVLDAAKTIHDKCSDTGRLARDNDMLRHQADELLTRVQELTTERDELQAEDDAKAETIAVLQAELERTRGRLIAARDELQSVRLP